MVLYCYFMEMLQTVGVIHLVMTQNLLPAMVHLSDSGVVYQTTTTINPALTTQKVAILPMQKALLVGRQIEIRMVHLEVVLVIGRRLQDTMVATIC